jgi:hypothetical protein
VAFNETFRLLPVHVPLGGLVMAAVGATPSPDVDVDVDVGDVVGVVVDEIVDVVVGVVVLVASAVAGAPDAYVGLVASL